MSQNQEKQVVELAVVGVLIYMGFRVMQSRAAASVAASNAAIANASSQQTQQQAITAGEVGQGINAVYDLLSEFGGAWF